MRLALFLHSLSMGGAQKRTVMLANGLAGYGHDVDLVTVLGNGVQQDRVSTRVNLVALLDDGVDAVAHGSERSWDLARGIPKLAAYLRRTRPDMFVAMANHAVIPAVLGHRLSGVGDETRLVLRASNHLSRRRGRARWLNRLVWPRADGVIAVAEDVARDVRDVTGLPGHRVLSAPSPIIPNDFPVTDDPAPGPRERRDGPVILAMGRFVRQKGFDTLLRAFSLLSRRQRARLVLIGDGPLRPDLQRLAAELGIQDAVEMPGIVQTPFAHLRDADLFVLPSRWEGMPAALVEAMACGCPVVATDCPGGVRELLMHGVYGPLVPVDDVEALADAMGAMLDRQPEAARLQSRALRYREAAAVAAYADALSRIRDAERRRPDVRPGDIIRQEPG